MKVVLLSGASTIHTLRWANGLCAAGVSVHIISQHPLLEPVDTGVEVHLFPYRGVVGYFSMVPGVTKLLKDIRPDIVNVHYASGYATTARLVGYRPWLLSVWGSDVYSVPYTSFLHKRWIAGNLKSADAVASTSHCMAEQIKSLVPSLDDIFVTPFGVDVHGYDDTSPPLLSDNPDRLVFIGTVKTMAPQYGIDILLRAFALLRVKLQKEKSFLSERLRLRLVGDGWQMRELQQLAETLRVREVTEFVGRVSHKKVPEELSKLDIFVALSREESFGVAVIEAGAAGLPVLVSDAGGLPEVVLDRETGLIVPVGDVQAAASALYHLVLNPQERVRMGKAGRRHVTEVYDWSSCVQRMIQVYKTTISRFKNT